MKKEIKEMIEKGKTRDAIFEELKSRTGNPLRLAQKIATIHAVKQSGASLFLNMALLAMLFVQTCFAIWVISTVVMPLDEKFAEYGIITISVLSLAYGVGVARRTFGGYSSYMLFCLVVLSTYIYGLTFVPVVSIVGLLLASINFSLTYYLKVTSYPHMGFLDVRKDEQGSFILE